MTRDEFRAMVDAHKDAGLQAKEHSWPPERSEYMLEGLRHQLHAGGHGSKLCAKKGFHDGRETLILFIKDADGKVMFDEHAGPYDFSHPCPPFGDCD